MSQGAGEVKGNVGSWKLVWKTIPRGPTGSALLEVEGRQIEVRWHRDDHGIWIEVPGGVYGFDMSVESGDGSDEGRKTFLISQRNSWHQWTGLSFTRAGEVILTSGGESKKKGFRVRAQMPGKIIRVLMAAGAKVEKDQPLAVMEAMKMENEIRAPHAGTLSKIHIVQGQAVETGADLFVIDSE